MRKTNGSISIQQRRLQHHCTDSRTGSLGKAGDKTGIFFLIVTNLSQWSRNPKSTIDITRNEYYFFRLQQLKEKDDCNPSYYGNEQTLPCQRKLQWSLPFAFIVCEEAAFDSWQIRQNIFRSLSSENKVDRCRYTVVLDELIPKWTMHWRWIGNAKSIREQVISCQTHEQRRRCCGGKMQHTIFSILATKSCLPSPNSFSSKLTS